MPKWQPNRGSIELAQVGEVATGIQAPLMSTESRWSPLFPLLAPPFPIALPLLLSRWRADLVVAFSVVKRIQRRETLFLARGIPLGVCRLLLQDSLGLWNWAAGPLHPLLLWKLRQATHDITGSTNGPTDKGVGKSQCSSAPHASPQLTS